MAEERAYYFELDTNRLTAAMHAAHSLYDNIKDRADDRAVIVAINENVPLILAEMLGSIRVVASHFNTNT